MLKAYYLQVKDLTSTPPFHVVNTQPSRRELLDNDLVELPLLGLSEQFLFLKNVLDDFVFQVRLVQEDLPGNRVDFRSVRQLLKQKPGEFRTLDAQTLSDLFDSWEERSPDVLDLLPLCRGKFGYEVEVSSNSGLVLPSPP